MWKLLISLFAILALASGCQKTSQRQKNVLRLNFTSPPNTIDPRKNGDLFSSVLNLMLYDGLTNLGPDGKVTLSLADSVDISDDSMTYTFHLRDATWSDGTPLTAYDFEESWTTVLTPDFPSLGAHLFYPIKNARQVKEGLLPVEQLGFKALDKRRFLIQLEHPTPYFLELISSIVFFPVPANIDQKKPDWDKKIDSSLITSGAFKLNKWIPSREIGLVKNNAHWDADSVKLSRISISQISNEMTTLQIFEKGELDWIGSAFSPLPLDAIPRQVKSNKLLTCPSAGTMICCFNSQSFPFDNLHIRKALSQSINRKALVEHIMQSNDEVAEHFIPPVLFTNPYQKVVKDNAIIPANKQFEAGLEELGLTKETFPTLTFLYQNTEADHKIAQALQQQWRKALGIKVQIIAVDQKILLDSLTRKNYQFALFNWIAQYNDPMDILERFLHKSVAKNYSGWESPSFISMVERSLETSDPAKREKLLTDAEKTLAEEVPVTPLFHFNSTYMQNPKLKGVSYSPVRMFHVKWAYFTES